MFQNLHGAPSTRKAPCTRDRQGTRAASFSSCLQREAAQADEGDKTPSSRCCERMTKSNATSQEFGDAARRPMSRCTKRNAARIATPWGSLEGEAAPLPRHKLPNLRSPHTRHTTYLRPVANVCSSTCILVREKLPSRCFIALCGKFWQLGRAILHLRLRFPRRLFYNPDALREPNGLGP